MYCIPAVILILLLNPNPTEFVSGLYTKGAFWIWICMDGLVKPCNGG